ncbi:MAG: GNAT family N-acetyltransferase [archaeon]
MMAFSAVELSDLRKILPLIKKEFSYTKMTLINLRMRFKDTKKFLFLKVLNDSELAGFAEVEFLEKNLARINGIAILESFRRKGYGKFLLENVLCLLTEMGALKVILLVRENNENARALYEKFGFKKYYADKISKVDSFSLDLNPFDQYSFAA